MRVRPPLPPLFNLKNSFTIIVKNKNTIMENNKKCDYGCGQKAKHQLYNGKWCCNKSPNSCLHVRKKNSKGLKKAYKEGRKNLNHFDGLRGWSAGKLLLDKNDVFKKRSNYRGETLKKYINHFNLKEYRCEKCENNGEWLDNILVLEIDHIDGDRTNNELENLRYLCPNCHSQTDTFRGRNLNKGIQKVSDEELKNALIREKNIRQALLKVGMAGKGGNYKRANRIIKKYNISFSKKNTKKEKKCENPNCNNIHINDKYCSEDCYYDHGIQKPRPDTRKVERPPYEQLLKEIEETNYSAVGRKYGVSDNAIRKWVRWYEKRM